MLAFMLYPFIQALIIILCFVLPLKKLSITTRLILSFILGLGSFRIYIYLFTGGTIMDPLLSRCPAIIIDCVYFTTIFICLLTLVRMIVNGLFKLIRFDFKRYVIPAFSTRYAILFFMISAFLGCLGTINGFIAPVDKYYSVFIENLPNEASNFKIIHLADLHISEPTTEADIQEIVDRSNAKHPDLVVITGDFVDGDIQRLDHMTKILFELKAKYGVYAVSGNHEFYSGYQEWLDYFSKGGIKFLENDSVTLKDNEGHKLFNLLGLMDISAPRFGFEGANIKKGAAKLDSTVPTIALTHQPKTALDLDKISSLTLAGHTHGGLMPGLRQIVASANAGFVSGLYEHQKQVVIVSNGTRIWAGVPLRLNTPSQLIIITLKNQLSLAQDLTH